MSVAPTVSVAVIVTECVPTSLLVGVPDKTPEDVLKESHDGIDVPVNVTVSPESTSLVVTVYE